MPYDLEQFITDCRSSLARDPSPTGREQVRVNLERLLSNKDFIEKYCGDDAPRGLNLLYEDQNLASRSLHISTKKPAYRRHMIMAPHGRSMVKRQNIPT